jgi:hypothetical protein
MMLARIELLCLLTLGADSNADRVIQKHEDALSRLHSIRATVVSRRSTDAGKTWRPNIEISIVKSGQRERFHEISHGGTYAGQWRDGLSHRDFAYSRSDYKIMAGVDPRVPPKLPLTGLEKPPVSGAIFPPDQSGPHGHKVSWTLSLLFIPDSGYSLGELYRISKKKSFRTGMDVGGEVYIFSIVNPGGQFSHEVTLSPHHNYSISKLSTKYTGDKEAGIPPYFYIEDVDEFYDYDLGLSIPRMTHITNESDRNERVNKTITVESINVPIPEAELELEFLPGTRVNDFAGKAFHIWGKGKPDRSFGTAEEFNKWIVEQQATKASTHKRELPWGSIIALSILSLVLVVLLVARSKVAPRLRPDRLKQGSV